MEPQQGSALMLATILTICFVLLNCLPDPPTAVNPNNKLHQQSRRSAELTSTSSNQVRPFDEDDLEGGEESMSEAAKKRRFLDTLKTSCLPKLVCQLLASTDRKLSRSELSLLALIKETSLGVTAEVTSRLHFAAHMGQLVAGVDGAGCHNFYPECPLPGNDVLPLLASVRSRGFGKGFAS